MDYATHQDAIAWTTPNGIFIDYNYATKYPEDIPALIAHEITHHVIKMDAGEFSQFNLNVALDYKINQFLYEKLGYDVRKIHKSGLLNKRYFKLSVVQILEELAKKGYSGQTPTSFGYETTHPLISRCADHIKVRFADYFRNMVTEDYFAMDLEDMAKYHAVSFAARKVEMDLPLKDFERVYRGVWCHLSLPKTAAPLVVDDFNREDALVYCINGQSLRSVVKEDGALGAVLTKTVLERLGSDLRDLTARINMLTKRISYISQKRGVWSSRQARERRAAIKRTKRLLQKASKEVTVNEFFTQNTIVKLKNRPLSLVTSSLKSGLTKNLQRSEYEKAVQIPFHERNAYSRRIYKVSTRVAKDMSKVKDVSNALESLFPRLKDELSQEQGKGKTPKSLKEHSSDNNESEEAGTSSSTKTKILQYEEIAANLSLLKNILMYFRFFKTALESKVPTQPNEDSFGQSTLLQYGNDLANLVPSELALLANPETELEFYVKLANRSLLTYAPPDKKRYPVLISIDGSGSMKSVYPKVVGFTLALTSILLKDNRGVVLQIFADDISSTLVLDPKQSWSLHDLLNVICYPTFGGTDFDKALRGAYRVKENLKWPHFSVIMITDGYCEVINPQEIHLRKTDKDRIIVASTASVPKSSVFDDLFRLKLQKHVADLVSVGKSVL